MHMRPPRRVTRSQTSAHFEQPKSHDAPPAPSPSLKRAVTRSTRATRAVQPPPKTPKPTVTTVRDKGGNDGNGVQARQKRKRKRKREGEDATPKKEQRGVKPLRRAAIEGTMATDKQLAHVLQTLNKEIDRLQGVFDPSVWMPPRWSSQSSTASSPPSNLPLSSTALFESALADIRAGVQLLEYSSTELSNQSQVLSLPTLVAAKKKSVPKKKPLTVSPFFPVPLTESHSKARTRTTSKTSPHFETDPFSKTHTPTGLDFGLQPRYYGLIQERIRASLYALVVQAILWNQTKGKAARPVLFALLTTYPTPETLAEANVSDVSNSIARLGLQKIRSERLVKMAKAWVASPPCPSRRYGKRNYPHLGDNLNTRDGELLEPDDGRVGWEIAHLPGVGPYALDSYRIFFRDTLRGIEETDDTDPEWKRVLPLDKDLRPYLQWKWKQGKSPWDWDPETGKKTALPLYDAAP